MNVGAKPNERCASGGNPSTIAFVVGGAIAAAR
jgi:hypothetical protein